MPLAQISVAVIGAGMAGRSHAAGYRQANTVFGRGFRRSGWPRSRTPMWRWPRMPRTGTG